MRKKENCFVTRTFGTFGKKVSFKPKVYGIVWLEVFFSFSFLEIFLLLFYFWVLCGIRLKGYMISF